MSEREPCVPVARAKLPARKSACMACASACPAPPAEPRRESVAGGRRCGSIGAARRGRGKAGADLGVPPSRTEHEEVTAGAASRFRTALISGAATKSDTPPRRL
jgi:hypothetical protein